MLRILLSTILILATLPTSAFILIRSEASGRVKHLLGNEPDQTVFRIPLSNVSTYLPNLCRLTFAKRPIALLAIHPNLPLRYGLSGWQKHGVPADGSEEICTLDQLFSYMRLNKAYTYVVSDTHLVFAESISVNLRYNVFKDLVSKHILLADRKREVRYAGELVATEAYSQGKKSLIFDNGSGTYQPPKERLVRLQALLESNLNPERKAAFEILALPFAQKAEVWQRINEPRGR